MDIFVVNIICITFSFLLGLFVNKALNNSLIFLKDNQSIFHKSSMVKIVIPCYLLSYTLVSFLLQYRDIFSRIIQISSICILLFVLCNTFFKSSKKKRNLNRIQKEIEYLILNWLEVIGYKQKKVNFRMNIYYEGRRVRGEVFINMPENIKIPIEKRKSLEQKLWCKHIMLHFIKME